MRRCEPGEACQNCSHQFHIDMEKCLYGTLCARCYDRHMACVMAFFVGLYEERHVNFYEIERQNSYKRGFEDGYHQASEDLY
jgi:hypothetical protein